jgi:hypothetical protein
MMSWSIDAVSTHGAYIVLMRDIPTHDGAKDILEQILKQVAQRKTRMVSLGDIVFDPECIMAYSLRGKRVWDEEDSEDDDTPQEIMLDWTSPLTVPLTAPPNTTVTTTSGAPSGVTSAPHDTMLCAQDVSP